MSAKPKEQAAMDAYAEAVASARMRNIRLIKSDFSMEPEGVGGDPRAWKNGFSCKVVKVTFLPDRNLLSALVAAHAYCKVGRTRIVSLKCDYAVTYDIVGQPEEKAATLFAERVGTFAVYPYFRAHFAEVTSQAGLALGPLPVLKEGPRVIPKGLSSRVEKQASKT